MADFSVSYVYFFIIYLMTIQASTVTCKPTQTHTLYGEVKGSGAILGTTMWMMGNRYGILRPLLTTDVQTAADQG